MVKRNPYIQEDLFNQPKRWQALNKAMQQRLTMIRERAHGNQDVFELVELAEQAVTAFQTELNSNYVIEKKLNRLYVK